MGYCWKCGNKLEDDMAFCPKCGSAVNQPSSHDYVKEDKVIRTVGLAIVGVLVAVAVLIVVLLAVGVLPGIQSPFGTIGSGHATTVQYNFTDFTAVSASHGFTVSLTQGTTYNIGIITDDNIQQYIDVRREGSTLYIGLKPGMGVTTTQLRAEITVPTLTNLQLSGGSQANGDFNMSGNFVVDLSGGSRVIMSGAAADLAVSGSGGSQVNLQDLQVQNAQVDLSGGSQARINLTGRLDATLSGGSQLHYRGNPSMGNIDTSGGSSISPIT
ncbi:zinc-ribbon domain-containing protein [Candidatus Bathyarchaeota archaeon]|nr:zinc-ribbon domain-containing protein [Candidatus Bathyarchaeota archaeon]